MQAIIAMLRGVNVGGHNPISMQALQKLAETMGCQVVYAVVPRGGKTLAELAEWQEWTRRLGSRD